MSRKSIEARCLVNHGLWARMPQDKDDKEYLVPLKAVKVGGCLEGPLAIVDIDLTYINEDSESAIECSYEFPLDKDTVVSRLVAKIGDKEIEAKIKEKELAKEVYDNAMAGGNAAVYAEKKSNDAESMRI